MKICGIVAEYNPFHNGHKYQIDKTIKKTNCDAIIAVMSGNFVQRGSPASFDKWTRAKTAIQNGIDLVIELPTLYATASSEYFATGAINLLNSLNAISNVSFGMETDNIELLHKIVDVLIEEPVEYKTFLQRHLELGLSFPKAREEALKEYFEFTTGDSDVRHLLFKPNTILAIEYLKALKKSNSSIDPIAIKRFGTEYDSIELDSNTNICSSTAIREKLTGSDIESIKNYIPSTSFEIIKNEIEANKFINGINNFENEILYSLRRMSSAELSHIADVAEGLENSIYKALNNTTTLEELINNVKTKRYTLTRIQRILIHTLLGIKSNYLLDQKYTPQYARVLAMSEKGKKVLSEISKTSSIPIVTSIADFMKIANNKQKEMLELDILATNIYTLGYNNPSQKKFNLDYTMPL